VPWTVPGATSDADGAFRLPAVPREATALVAVAAGYRTAHVTLSPPGDTKDRVVRVRLVAAPPVDGDVLDPDGKPVRARVVACAGQPAASHAESGEDGTFRLPPAAFGCSVVAQHDDFGSSDPTAVVEGERVVLRLKPGGSIEGVVVDDRGRGISPFTVGIESFSRGQARSSGGRPARPFDDPQGVFRWEKLAPGSYVLTASTPGKPPARSDEIDVSPGAVTNVRIVLVDGGSVVGRVTDEVHAPLAGALLAFDATSSVIDTGIGATTDGDGRYRLDGAPLGSFTIRVWKAGYRMRFLAALSVAPHATLTRDIVLTAFDGSAGTELGGIGANVTQTTDGIAFGNVFPGDPADRAGVHPGDRILRVDGEETDRMSVADVLQRIRGEAGTTVGLSVQRANGDTTDVVVTRGLIVH
jgi:hypothetical protein